MSLSKYCNMSHTNIFSSIATCFPISIHPYHSSQNLYWQHVKEIDTLLSHIEPIPIADTHYKIKTCIIGDNAFICEARHHRDRSTCIEWVLMDPKKECPYVFEKYKEMEQIINWSLPMVDECNEND